MDPAEYANLEQLDRLHWFYRGKRAIVRHWIDRYVDLGGGDLLVDAGMGTGSWLVEMGDRCRVVGLDDHEESLAIAGPRLAAVGGSAMRTGLQRVDLPDGCATVVTMMDVLEHLDDDAGALREMVRLTRPGGVLVLTVPAMRWLWSDWDVTLHHRRRYHRRDLMALFAPLGVEVLRCSYFNTVAIAPTWLVRTLRGMLPPGDGRRAEDRLPHPALNRALYEVMVRPARWEWLDPPFGVSLLAVLRRKPAAPGAIRGPLAASGHEVGRPTRAV